MQTVVGSVESVNDDACSMDLMWNANQRNENLNQQDANVPSCSMASPLLMNLEMELKKEVHNGVVCAHRRNNPRSDCFYIETNTASFALSDILKAALSPMIGEGCIESSGANINELNEGQRRMKHRTNLSEEEKRAERNRKGRERSMRTRRRNAAHLKMLEDGCTRFIMENRLLRDLLNCLHDVQISEEKVISLLRNLLSRSRLSTASQPSVELLRDFSMPLRSNPSQTYRKMISNDEDHCGSCTCSKVHRTRTLPRTDVLMGITKKIDRLTPENQEADQILKSAPECSNVSRASMSARKAVEAIVDLNSEGRLQNPDGQANEISQGQKLVDFSMAEIVDIIPL